MTDEAIKTGELRSPEMGVMVKYKVFSHFLDFEAKEYTPQPDESDVFYDIENQEYPTEFEKGERFVDGWVKWDGCSHYYFGDKRGYLHLCGGRSFSSLAWVLRETFLLASREIPHFDAECADLAEFRGSSGSQT